jgi:hypothetical protein
MHDITQQSNSKKSIIFLMKLERKRPNFPSNSSSQRKHLKSTSIIIKWKETLRFNNGFRKCREQQDMFPQ